MGEKEEKIEVGEEEKGTKRKREVDGFRGL